MTVGLLHNTPLWVCAKAIRKCWASEGKSDTPENTINKWYPLEDDYDIECGEKDKELIYRIGNKMKHKSTLEHLVYTFDIDEISRACLQEVARHRIASYSVKSTRYTLKELKETTPQFTDYSEFLVKTGHEGVDYLNRRSLADLQRRLLEGTSNDIAKYMLPEAYKTSLVMTINARALQNFLELRTSKSALWEIQDLAKAMFEALPEEHKYLFEEYINN